MNAKNIKGFTLIELLVVVSIIGVLASIVLSSINSARDRATDQSFVAGIRQIQNALELYYIDNGRYPSLDSAIIIREAVLNSQEEAKKIDFHTALSPYLDLTNYPKSLNPYHWILYDSDPAGTTRDGCRPDPGLYSLSFYSQETIVDEYYVATYLNAGVFGDVHLHCFESK